MEDSEILALLKKAKQIAKREKVSINTAFKFDHNLTSVDVTTSDELTMRGRRLLETILHIKTETSHAFNSPTSLTRTGSRTNKEGDKFELWLLNAAKCKVIGTKKEIRQVRKVVEPEKFIIVEEEVDVPIYECPKGVILEQ